MGLRHHRPATGSRGFTLIELLVSMALMTILTGSVVFVFIQAQKIFVTLDAKVQVYQNVRYAFDQMERDIANMVKTVDMEFHNDTLNKGHYDPGEEISDPFGRYDFACTIRQPEDFVGFDDGLPHRRDSLYFRTVASVDRRVKEVLVEYEMVDTDRVRPKLVRRLYDIVSVNADGTLVPRTPPLVNELCLYVMDFQVEFWFDNKRTDRVMGTYFSADDVANAINLQKNPLIDAPFLPYRAMLGVRGTECATYYRNGGRPNSPVSNRMVIQKVDGLLRTEDDADLGALEPGDTIFLYNASDARFPQRDYTIKRIFDSGSGWRIELREPLDLAGLSGDVVCSYRAGFLPAALRISVKIKDAKAKELRTNQRIFRVLGS